VSGRRRGCSGIDEAAGASMPIQQVNRSAAPVRNGGSGAIVYGAHTYFKITFEKGRERVDWDVGRRPIVYSNKALFAELPPEDRVVSYHR